MYAHFHTGTMTHMSPRLGIEQRTGYVCINPKDARVLEISEGGVLVLSSHRGDMETLVKITPAVAPGTLFLPIHFGEKLTNVLTNAEAFDSLAEMPEFKVAAVRVEKLTA
jgi:anaerobic selenocysteine-containing dehydrogenase